MGLGEVLEAVRKADRPEFFLLVLKRKLEHCDREAFLKSRLGPADVKCNPLRRPARG